MREARADDDLTAAARSHLKLRSLSADTGPRVCAMSCLFEARTAANLRARTLTVRNQSERGCTREHCGREMHRMFQLIRLYSD